MQEHYYLRWLDVNNNASSELIVMLQNRQYTCQQLNLLWYTGRTALCWWWVFLVLPQQRFFFASLDFCFAHIEVLIGMDFGGEGEAVPVSTYVEGFCSR